MSYTILYNPSIRREMAKLSRAVLQRIDGAILALSDNARPPGSAKLSGHDLWRVRVGDYRILYSVDDAEKTVTIALVAHRRESYRGL